MSVVVTNRKGRKVTLLNPAEKGRKYADELANGARLTNDGFVKFDKNGKPIRLTDTQKAYRSGFLDARKEAAKVYNAKRRD